MERLYDGKKEIDILYSRWYDKKEVLLGMPEWKLNAFRECNLGDGWEEEDGYIEDGPNGCQRAVLKRVKYECR